MGFVREDIYRVVGYVVMCEILVGLFLQRPARALTKMRNGTERICWLFKLKVN